MITDITAQELAQRLGSPQEPVVIDVREPDEFEDWKIPGARNIPLGELIDRVQEIPTNEPVVVMCAGGTRSALGAGQLHERGFDVLNLTGGIRAWASVYDEAIFEVGDVKIIQVRRRGKGCLSYIVGAGDEAFVVDPSLEIERYRSSAAERGWKITHVFDTHLHADHLSGARQLAALSGAELYLNPADTFDFPYTPITDGASYRLGEQVDVSVSLLSSPGHTMGSTLLFIGDVAVLSGDTIFVDGVGRPDLADRAEDFAHHLYASLHTKVLCNDDDLLVLPAHYGASVRVSPEVIVGANLGELRAALPELSLSEDEFVTWATSRATPRPPNYALVITANMGRGDSALDLAALEMGPNRCSA